MLDHRLKVGYLVIEVVAGPGCGALANAPPSRCNDDAGGEVLDFRSECFCIRKESGHVDEGSEMPCVSAAQVVDPGVPRVGPGSLGHGEV